MNDKIKNLLKLIQDNPELEVLPMVNSECVGGDDYSYWCAEWGKAEIDEYYSADERIYFKSTDYDELVDECEGVEGEEEAEFIVNNLKWIKAIVVHIDSI